MQVVYTRCAGLDVHKKTVSACVSVCEGGGAKWQQTRVFGTFTHDLLALADWLQEHAVTHVAMEATSVYWRPVWAVLEGFGATPPGSELGHANPELGLEARSSPSATHAAIGPQSTRSLWCRSCVLVPP